jgi:hypothetical protein
MRKKKVISFMLAVSMVFSLLSVPSGSVHAEETQAVSATEEVGNSEESPPESVNDTEEVNDATENNESEAVGENGGDGGSEAAGEASEDGKSEAVDEASEDGGSEAVSEDDKDGELEEVSDEKKASVLKTAKAAGETVTGTFQEVSGYDIATVRYLYTGSDGNQTYGFAEVSELQSDGYTYTFKTPTDDYEVVQGSNLDSVENATVIAEYYNLSKWDGAVDVSWYNETDTDFYLYTPAELAGFAAVVNGSVDGEIEDYQVKGTRSNPEDRSVNRGLPDCIESDYFESTSLIAGVTGSAYKGVMKHDFADRTVHLMADMDMGGVDGSEIDMGEYDIGVDNPESNWNRKLYDYPNWTPIGGEYLMDVTDADSMIISFFNGTIDGNGHYVNNLYCYRWSYRTVGDTAYGYSQGVGFVGDMGTLYDDSRGTESNPSTMPAIRNMGLSGFIYGRRMVGGFVGCIGGGSNAADGSTVEGGITLENLVNHAYVYCTDSKGLGGIVGASMSEGSIINCYNDGNLTANYAAPTGGIVGSNEGMDIYCCYNLGSVYALQSRGRGIGSDNSGKNYTIDNCYYLENSGNDPTYPGYYTYNLPASVSVNVTEMSQAQMKSGKLLEGLNTNGIAYVQGDDGYPVLYWEKESGTGTLTVDESCQGGTISAGSTGSMANGSVVYLENEAETGWNFRNYTYNGETMTGDYITVNGDTTVSAVFESSKAGVLKIAANTVCTISVTKNGTVVDADGTATTVTDYPVQAGDPIYEGDVLIVEAHVKDGMVPSDEGYSYRESVGATNPFEYQYQYTGGDVTSTNGVTYKVGSEINGDDVSLTLTVVALTTEKLWKYMGDTSWYSDDADEFTITTAAQLAGLEVLVEEGETFAGKTVKLGNDISLANPDGTGGNRYWDGIGAAATSESSVKVFAGTFDGQGYKITELNGNKNALFAYVYGESTTSKAVIKNVSVYGAVNGSCASGIVYDGKYLDISNCESYCALQGTSAYSAGIIGRAGAGVSVTDCVNYGNISSVGKVGGIAGDVDATATITNCLNKGDILCQSTNGNNVGGIAGSLSGKLSVCANYGNIAAWGRNIGGVAGQSVSTSSTITDCYNVGTITFNKGTNQNDCVGGIIGYASYYKVYNSYNYGQVITKSSTNYSGGIFGREGKRSSSVTKEVYYLAGASDYVENNITFADLDKTLNYTTGMNSADESTFASDQGVLAAINTNGNYVLTNDLYPEFEYVAKSHVHTGGTATCTNKAVCESCGLEYGEVDPDNHVESVLRNATEAAWTTDGYTGDMVCRDCGTITEKGSAIKADTKKDALTVVINVGDEQISTKTYSVEELDALKTVSSGIAYTYGGTHTEMMVATEYVTIEKLAEEFGYSYSQVEKIKLSYAGNTDTVEGDVLRTCNKYYDDDGNEYDAPASISMNYASLTGTVEEIAHESCPTNALRFGYGISEQQYKDNTNLGGRRLVSPVTQITFYMSEAAEKEGYTVSGAIAGYAGNGSATVALIPEGESESAYTASGTGEYSISEVAAGTYTLRVSADGLYVDRDYEITVGDTDLTQDVAICQLGDTNMDGKFSSADVTIISRHVSRIKYITDPYVLLLADTDRSNSITVADASHLSRYLAKIDAEL